MVCQLIVFRSIPCCYMKNIIVSLLSCSAISYAAITPVNPGFEDLSAAFPSGWNPSGTVSQTLGLGSPIAASLASGASVHQDFASTLADGLVTFTTSFTLRLEGIGSIATNTSRIRFRGNNSVGDLITLRITPSGIESFTNGTWTAIIPFANQLGTAYTVTLEVANLDADAALEYRVTCSDGTTNDTSAIQNVWHGPETTANFPFETILFAPGAGNTLTLDNMSLPGFAMPAQLVANSGFEVLPFPASWTAAGGTVSVAGLNGTANAARLPYATSANLEQAVSGVPADFTADLSFQIAGNNEPQAFRWQLGDGTSNVIDLRTATGGTLQANLLGEWVTLQRITDSASFNVTANQTVRLRVTGRNFGTTAASYDIVWSDPGSSALVHAVTGITAFASGGIPAATPVLVRFVREVSTANSFLVDDVTVLASASTPPAADYSLVPPVPPVPDKIVNISGVYPHLVMTNTHLECGVGAVVPWAGKLWAMTYGPHIAYGGSDKLYEIAPDLSRVIRPESVGGTPANRFIHTTSNQLNIGPYFIDATRNVRVLSPSVAPGRHTATAAHLTDPNRLYIFTMEDGVYDINATDLTFITRYPDVQGMGDRFLFGYHGKGAYTGQGQLVVANNGRPNNQGTPTGPAGVLAMWNGTTVAQNGGSYFATNDPNNTAEENTVNPVTAQPDYIAGWTQISKTQHCEVTGPGGIYGNPNPATDPIWSTGFDAKSVLLHVMENKQWQLWRLPKGSYSHDGSHGWHTEWPRIRQLDPADPNSIYLMHMHGLFYNFPKTFSAANFAGLSPISSYYKMPTDYAMFNGKIVMGKNDASKFENTLAQKCQSNLWFGTMADIENWGSPTGHGSVWMNEAVSTGQYSAPFLISGFSQRTLHLRNLGASAVNVEIQTSSGSTTWTAARSINVPAGGYAHEILNDLSAPWVRLQASSSSSNLTAFFHLHSPYPHTTPASAASNEFAAIADIRDTRSMSDGIIRVRDNTDLSLEFASSRTSSSGSTFNHRYHLIGGDIELKDVTDASAESTMRSSAATSKQFGSDSASAWVDSGGTRFRLPKLDPLYDSPFAAGWARGVREAVTERELLNCHGTFYEVPRANSGGYRKMRALTTHGKRISDFASWRGLFVLTGVLDDAPPSNRLVKNPDGTAALWLGEIDDLWRMGEPRGTGGPWKDSAVAANTASDPYLMYGYDHKELTLSATDATTITVELDFLADNTWSIYQTFSLSAGETLTHVFPAGFHAHWVRVKSSTATTASAQFTYGPADVRDRFLDWARDNNIPTSSGRDAISNLDPDGDGLPHLLEFLINGNPNAFDPNPITFANGEALITLRDLEASDAIISQLEFSEDLTAWEARLTDVVPATDQSGTPAGFTRFRILTHPEQTKLFVRLRAR
jgi:hypothetical protein